MLTVTGLGEGAKGFATEVLQNCRPCARSFVAPSDSLHGTLAHAQHAGDVSFEEARWRGQEDVRGGRTFPQVSSAFQEGVRSKLADIEGLMQVGGHAGRTVGCG
jgi:hypothetical protein